MWFKVAMHGRPGHVLAATAGTNAIEKAWPVIAALRRLEAEMNAEERPAVYGELPHPLNLNIGIFRGGDWPSTVPAAAEFHGRLSFFPGTSYETVCRRIEDAVTEAARKDPWVAENPPAGDLLRLPVRGPYHRPRTPGFGHPERMPPGAQRAGRRQLRLHLHHRPARLSQFRPGAGTCYGPVAENIHAANERVEMASILQTARTYALFLTRWCGIVD